MLCPCMVIGHIRIRSTIHLKKIRKYSHIYTLKKEPNFM
jgi:hypothetical protein